jgi:hypothetical protein
MISVSRKPVDTGSQEEMCTSVVGRAEQFVDVALAVADVDDALWRCEQRRRLFQILQPAIAFLLLDGDAGGLDPAFQRVRAMEFVPGPET